MSVDEVGRAVDRVNYEGWIIGQASGLGSFFAEEARLGISEWLRHRRMRGDTRVIGVGRFERR